MRTADVDHCWVSLTTFDAAICFHIDDRLVTVRSTNVIASFCNVEFADKISICSVL